LGAERIDHGIGCLEDPDLVTRLANERIPLTVCPLSNVALRVVDDLTQHPLRHLLERGLAVSVHSDDPAYFGGYLTENLLAITKQLDLSTEQVATLLRNAIETSSRHLNDEQSSRKSIRQ
jgi:adenosine deaminase